MNETGFVSTLQTVNQAFWGFFDWWGILILFAAVILLLYLFREFYLTQSLFLDLLDFGFGWVTYAFYLLGLQENTTALVIFHGLNVLVAVYIWYSSRSYLHWFAQIVVFLKVVYIAPEPWFPTNVFPIITLFGFTWNTARKAKEKEKEAKKKLQAYEQQEGKDKELEATEKAMETAAGKEAMEKAEQKRKELEQQLTAKETEEEVRELLTEVEEKCNRLESLPEEESLTFEQLSTRFQEAEEIISQDPEHALQILLALRNELSEQLERLDALEETTAEDNNESKDDDIDEESDEQRGVKPQ